MAVRGSVRLRAVSPVTRIAITGASGFVGANLADRLLRSGVEVHALLRPKHDPWRLAEMKGLRVHAVDVTNAQAVDAVLGSVRPEIVYHLAAYGAYHWQHEVATIQHVNVLGTLNVVRAAITSGCSSVVVAGSSSEYGFKDHAPGEDEVVAPNSDYAISKTSATHYCGWLSARSGVPVTTLRLYSVYGPFEEPRRLIPRVIHEGLLGRLPELAGPEVARDFIHVEDVCDAFVLCAERVRDCAAVFNVATGRQVTLRQVAAIAREHFGIAGQPQWGSYPGRPWDTSVWVGDASRLRSLGWTPRIEFADGFASTAEWWASSTSAGAKPACPK